MRLLLVEDDVMVASGIKLGLSNAGYAVDWVGTGERAEEVLRTEVFDAAIIDIGLPQMDGLELTRRLRRPEMASRKMPVLILTARDALQDRVQGLELGPREWTVLEYLLINAPKPASKEKLLQALTGWDKEITPNAVEVYISRLRGKREPHGVALRSIRGFGYRLELNETQAQ